MSTFLKCLFYVYVVFALAPFAVLSIYVGGALANGGSPFPPWLMPDTPTFLVDDRAPAKVRGTETKRSVTFRSKVFALPNHRPEDELYAIGVSRAAVIPSNPTTEDMQELIASYGEGYVVGDQTELRGAFTNLVVWNRRTGAVSKMFDKAVYVSAVAKVGSETSAVLVFAATSDTNKDGKVGMNDAQTLFVYTLADGRLHTIEGLIGSAVAVETSAGKPGEALIRISIDQNGDGATWYPGRPAVDMAEDPQRLYRVDLKKFKATPVVPQDVVDQLQHDIDAATAVKQ